MNKNKVIKFESFFDFFRYFGWGFLIMKITSIISDKLIVFIVLNVFVFYDPIEKKYPHFLFNSVMSVRQLVEGIFEILECLIPRYTEKKEK